MRLVIGWLEGVWNQLKDGFTWTSNPDALAAGGAIRRAERAGAMRRAGELLLRALLNGHCSPWLARTWSGQLRTAQYELARADDGCSRRRVTGHEWAESPGHYACGARPRLSMPWVHVGNGTSAASRDVTLCR